MKQVIPGTMNFIGATVLLIFLFGQFAFTAFKFLQPGKYPDVDEAF